MLLDVKFHRLYFSLAGKMLANNVCRILQNLNKYQGHAYLSYLRPYLGNIIQFYRFKRKLSSHLPRNINSLFTLEFTYINKMQPLVVLLIAC